MDTTLAEDKSLIPNTHVGWLTTASDSSSRGSKASDLPVHTPTYPHLIKNLKSVVVFVVMVVMAAMVMIVMAIVTMIVLGGW